jgi:hypothetical protein
LLTFPVMTDTLHKIQSVASAIDIVYIFSDWLWQPFPFLTEFRGDHGNYSQTDAALGAGTLASGFYRPNRQAQV